MEYNGSMKKFLVPLLIVFAIGLSAIFVGRFLFGGDEDTWICVDNQWVKHGNPKVSMPQTGCGSQKKENDTNEVKPGEFANGQKYEIYKTDDFEIKYPYWPNIDKKNLLEPENVKLAVVNAGCNFIVNVVSVPANTNFKDYTEKLAQEEIAKTKGKIITQNIKDDTAHFVGEITMGNVTLRSVSYGYLTSKRQSYDIAFIAEKNQFETACQPFIDEVVESVKAR